MRGYESAGGGAGSKGIFGNTGYPDHRWHVICAKVWRMCRPWSLQGWGKGKGKRKGTVAGDTVLGGFNQVNELDHGWHMCIFCAKVRDTYRTAGVDG